MNEAAAQSGEIHLTALVLLVGGLVVACALVRAGLERLRLPAILGYFALGFAIRCADLQWGFLDSAGKETFDFLARLGIIALLFRAGLDSNLRSLVSRLRSASVIWMGDTAFSALVGFAAARYLVGLEFIPSLVAGTALVATSVGVPVQVWKRAGKLDTEVGEVFLDVAEMDDISGVMLMALLFAILPTLQAHGGERLDPALAPVIGKTLGIFVIKLLVFGAFCFLFAQYLEEPMTRLFKRLEPEPEPMLLVAGFGIAIAAMAGLIGFSEAIGAFFAGLIFSRDPDRIKLDANFSAVHDLLAPFFFIGIGLTMAPDALTGAVGIGAVLLLAAVAGKTLGDGVPALRYLTFSSAALFAVSMMPRAEIAMVIMKKGHKMGTEVVPDSLFSAMVLVSAVTCAVAPVVLHWALNKVDLDGGKS